MTLENWVKNSWLEKRASDREEIGRRWRSPTAD